MSSSRVLVLGVTGKAGSRLVRKLLQRGVHVRAFVRDEAKARELFGAAENLTFVVGDHSDTAKFPQAVENIDRVYINTSYMPCEVPLVKAAAAAGVKHVVRVSCIFAGTDCEAGSIFQKHGALERELAQIFPNLTNLRPHDFMQNILRQADTIKATGKFYGTVSADTFVSSISADDIAASAAAVLLAPIELHAGQTYTITGPAAHSYHEVATILGKVIGRPIEFVQIPDAAYYKTMVGSGMPPAVARYLVEIPVLYRLRLSGHRWTTGYVEIITGNQPGTWEQFFEENKAAFV